MDMRTNKRLNGSTHVQVNFWQSQKSSLLREGVRRGWILVTTGGWFQQKKSCTLVIKFNKEGSNSVSVAILGLCHCESGPIVIVPMDYQIQLNKSRLIDGAKFNCFLSLIFKLGNKSLM